MGGILDLVIMIISLTARVLFVAIATPFILAWPRNDESLSYGQAVWSRYKRVLSAAAS